MSNSIFLSHVWEKIPPNNQYWKLYEILRRIFVKLTHPHYYKSDLDVLESLIAKHNAKYLELFGPLKPKMHFLLHYVQILRSIGPARLFWSTSFERKNKELKTYIQSTKCFKNMPWTIAMRNQLHLAYARKSKTNFRIYRLGKIENQCDHEINSIISEISSLPSFRIVKYLEMTFKIGTIIFYKCEINEPVFAKISNIYELNGKVCLLLKMYKSLGYEKHYCSYLVDTNEVDTKVCLINDIELLYPLGMVNFDFNISLIISKYEL